MKPPRGVRESSGVDGADRTPAASQLFGRYRLLARIGEGGMAEVYRAVITGPEGFEKELVLKRILPRLSNTGDFKTMFIREAKISAFLVHPNVVQIYDFGEAEGSYFIAMESVQGVTLREALTTLKKADRTMPHLIAAEVTRQMCVGLDYAHGLRGPDGLPLEIVHQDISPTNVMLAWSGTVKILDFGIARAASFAEEEAEKGIIKGKVSYLSPEQIHARRFDARADIFAVGVVFHEMLTGRRLFQSRNDIARMRQLLAQPIPPPSALDATIPRELDRITLRALEIDPSARYQTAADMAADLERTLIAARHSSRELANLLHELYLPSEEPPVVVEDPNEDARTTIATATNATGSAVATGSMRTTGSAVATPSVTSSLGSAGTGVPAPALARGRAEPDSSRLGGALRAERGRLQRTRWRRYAKIGLAAIALGAGAAGLGVAVKRLLPTIREVMKPAPPPPVTDNQAKPAPEPSKPPPEPARPARKHLRKLKPRPAAESPPATPPEPPTAPSPTPETP